MSNTSISTNANKFAGSTPRISPIPCNPIGTQPRSVSATALPTLDSQTLETPMPLDRLADIRAAAALSAAQPVSSTTTIAATIAATARAHTGPHNLTRPVAIARAPTGPLNHTRPDVPRCTRTHIVTGTVLHHRNKSRSYRGVVRGAQYQLDIS